VSQANISVSDSVQLKESTRRFSREARGNWYHADVHRLVDGPTTRTGVGRRRNGGPLWIQQVRQNKGLGTTMARQRLSVILSSCCHCDIRTTNVVRLFCTHHKSLVYVASASHNSFAMAYDDVCWRMLTYADWIARCTRVYHHSFASCAMFIHSLSTQAEGEGRTGKGRER